MTRFSWLSALFLSISCYLDRSLQCLPKSKLHRYQSTSRILNKHRTTSMRLHDHISGKTAVFKSPTIHNFLCFIKLGTEQTDLSTTVPL